MPRRDRAFCTIARSVLALALAATASGGGGARGARAVEPIAELGWWEPAALALAPDGQTLIIACRKSGRLVLADLERLEPVGDFSIGRSLVALAATDGGRRLAVCDEAASELVIVELDDRLIHIRARVPVPRAPVAVTIDPTGQSAYVSSLWARQLVQVDCATGRVAAVLPLDFAPRSSIFLPDGRTLVVAGAFDGRLALIDAPTLRVLHQVTVPGHNIRGLALAADGEALLVTHMILTSSATTTRDNVFWGITMTSNLRVIPIAALRDESKSPVREAHTHFFGDPGHAAGDPEALAVTPDGTALVCLGGVGELAVGPYKPYGFERVPVGRRPVAVALDSARSRAYVANAHSDTISVIDIAARASVGEIPLGVATPASWVEQGEQLFYDARLSLDGWFSCHSCHTDGHTNGQNADTFGDGAAGAPKNVPGLLGTSGTGPWAWNGSKPRLEDQVHDSLQTTMQPKAPPTTDHVAALTAYLESLAPPPPLPSGTSDPAAIARGADLFRSHTCDRCHTPPLYTSAGKYDVGLDDGLGGNRFFNPPSLRGVSQSAPYLHDGRARTLEAVFRDGQHGLSGELSERQLADLVAFLDSL